MSPGRRGRPVNPALRKGRREQLVASAYTVVTDIGYENMSMSHVAKQAGVGQGTVYRYFASKRELVDAVFDYAMGRIVEALELDSISEEDVADFDRAVALITVFGRRMFTLVDADPNIVRLATVDSSAIDTELRYRVLGMLGAVDAGIGAIVERANPEWSATADPAIQRLYGRMMFAMSGPGLYLSLMGVTTPEQRENVLATMTKIANAGILRASDENDTPPVAARPE